MSDVNDKIQEITNLMKDSTKELEEKLRLSSEMLEQMVMNLSNTNQDLFQQWQSLVKQVIDFQGLCGMTKLNVKCSMLITKLLETMYYSSTTDDYELPSVVQSAFEGIATSLNNKQ